MGLPKRCLSSVPHEPLRKESTPPGGEEAETPGLRGTGQDAMCGQAGWVPGASRAELR